MKTEEDMYVCMYDRCLQKIPKYFFAEKLATLSKLTLRVPVFLYNNELLTLTKNWPQGSMDWY